uniref:PHD-type domain-containing protein n=1 Tax=Spermophilus dauricus TaxID=99837 RepID=A0A8C9PWA1_SPEDA
PTVAPALDLEAEHSMDVILVGSSGRSSPSSVQLGRGEDICLCCGSFQVHTQHPLFEGGICAPCKDRFLEALFQYDQDGYQSSCSICGWGGNPDCPRCYCLECVDTLVGPGTVGRIHAMSSWVCFLCLPFSRSGLLQRRRKWRERLKAFQDREVENPGWDLGPLGSLQLLCALVCPTPELTSLGFLEPGSEAGRLRHLEDVTNIVRRDVEEWGPFDLVYGSTPALGHACDHSPGWYLFQFHRLLLYARPGSAQTFFWMFVDNLLLNGDEQAIATRFLETEPVILQDVRGSALQNAVRVWTNIPAVKSRHSALASEEELLLLAQDGQRGTLPAQGPSALVKNCFLPLREYFKYFSQNALPLYK